MVKPAFAATKARKRKPKILLVEPEFVGNGSRYFMTLPLHTVSELNKRGREHWSKRHKRAERQRYMTDYMFFAYAKHSKPCLPCEFKIVRLAPRKLDTHDNLRSATKAVVDSIAKWMGVDDSDPRLTFSYDQARIEPNTYGVRVEWTAT